MHSFLCQHPEIVTQPSRITDPHNWVEHIPFAFFFMKMIRPATLVELGVHTGNSFSAFCQATKDMDLPAKCYGIDLWQGDEHAGFYENEIYENLSSYINKNYPGKAQLIRKDFNQAVADFEDGSIDLLHIDGLHSYAAVKNDFDTWFSKLSKNGVVFFHDTQVKERDFGVYKFWEEVSSKFPHFEFKFGNGLGVLAVGEDANPLLLRFFEDAKKDDAISSALYYCGSKIFFEAEMNRWKSIADALEKRRRKNYYLKRPWLFISKIIRGKKLS